MNTKAFRLIAVLFATTLSLGFTSCGDDDDDISGGGGSTVPTKFHLSLYSNGLYTDGTLIYRIIDENEHKVQLVGTQDINITTLTVPEAVLIEAQRYTVTRIGRMHRWNSEYEENDPWLFENEEDSWLWDEYSEEETPQDIFYFHRCSKLTNINIPACVTSIRNNTFEDTPWYVSQPDGIVYAGKVAYRYKGVMPENTDLTIAAGTLGIADYAFRDCDGMTSVSIPSSLVTIGYNAFYDCRLEGVYISDLAAWCNIDAQTECGFGWDDTNPMYVADGLFLNGEELQGDIILPAQVTSIATGAFYGCDGLTNVSLPPTVKRIGHWAFMHCSNLCNINLPNSLERIEHDAFKHCRSLTSVVFPASLRYVGLSAYEDCTSLNEIVIPAVSLYLGERLFAYIHDLKHVTVLSNNPSAYSYESGEGNDVFKESSSNATLHVPAGCSYAYRNTWPWSNFNTIIDDANKSFAFMHTSSKY